MDAILPPLSVAIKDARTAQRLTREELAELVGVSSKSIQRYEEGRQIPRMPVLARLGSVLGIPVGSLLFDSGTEDYGEDEAVLPASPQELARMLRLVLARLDHLSQAVDNLDLKIEAKL